MGNICIDFRNSEDCILKPITNHLTDIHIHNYPKPTNYSRSHRQNRTAFVRTRAEQTYALSSPSPTTDG